MLATSLWGQGPVHEIQDLSFEILTRATRLSKRGKDAVRALFNQCGRKVAPFAYTLMNPAFSWANVAEGLGGKTLGELSDFTEDILKLLAGFQTVPGLEDWNVRQGKAKLIRFGLSGDQADGIIRLEHELGHFPLATFLRDWFSAHPERERYIFRHGFAVWEATEPEDLGTMGERLSVTRERLRQIRVRLAQELATMLDGLSLPGPCPYPVLSPDCAALTNKEEDTSFTADFLRYAIGLAFNDLSLVGSPLESFFVKLRGEAEDSFVAAIPSVLARQYDFNAFLAEMEAVNGRKRLETTRWELPSETGEITETAAMLALLRYGWKTEEGELVIPPNAEKNRSDIMEDIIRSAGRPLTIEEIAEEYVRRYPDRKTDRSRIQGNIHVNPRIVPMGRTGVYSLSEWNTGAERGGTIRSFVRECLDNSESHLVPAKEVYEYVRRFRPSSTDTNILSNLMLETEKSFLLVWKEDIPYLTYTSDGIPEGYRKYYRAFEGVRSSEESMEQLNRFVSRFGRMPRVCADSEETRLARFLSKVRGFRRRGLLKEEDRVALQAIESRLDGGVLQLELF